MVGVGPGVGADIIRQRRKRADKLKKEQKVRVIYIHGVPTIAALAPRSKKKDSAHYHWHYTPARDSQVFNKKRSDHNRSHINSSPRQTTASNAQPRRPSGKLRLALEATSSSQPISPCTSESLQVIKVNIIHASAESCLDATATSSESNSRSSRNPVCSTSTSFSETSSSSIIPFTGPNQEDHSTKQERFFNSAILRKNSGNGRDISKHSCRYKRNRETPNAKVIPTGDTELNDSIRKSKIEKQPTGESLNAHDGKNILAHGNYGVSIPTSQECNEPSTNSTGDDLLYNDLLPKIRILDFQDSGDSKNASKTSSHQEANLIPDLTTSFRARSTLSLCSKTSTSELGRKRNEMTMKEYHKYVARKNLMQKLNSKRTLPNKFDEPIAQNDKHKKYNPPSNEVSRTLNVLAQKRSLSILSLNINYRATDTIKKANEEAQGLLDEPISLASSKDDTEECSSSVGSTSVKSRLSFVNNAKRMISFKKIKNKSKSAISSMQKLIEIPFDRGKSE